ncbi:MAG: DUF1573 domain-containing protein, partial [Bacteroidota bacterium]
TIEFEQSNHDFGTIEEGTIVTRVFTFTNTGDEPLIIIDAKGSCGCTVPARPTYPIAPGETASITVQFNSKNKRGPRNQRVTITANTSPPQTFLSLTGTVALPDDEVEANFDFVPTEEAADAPLDPSCFAIYPNPTAEILKLDLSSHLDATVTVAIYSQNGQLMAERRILGVNSTEEFSVGHYPAGTYIAKVQVEGKQVESKCFVVVE